MANAAPKIINYNFSHLIVSVRRPSHTCASFFFVSMFVTGLFFNAMSIAVQSSVCPLSPVPCALCLPTRTHRSEERVEHRSGRRKEEKEESREERAGIDRGRDEAREREGEREREGDADVVPKHTPKPKPKPKRKRKHKGKQKM